MAGRIVPRWLKSRLVKKGLGFDQTRVFISAAFKIDREIINFFANLNIHIFDIYGQTETAGPLTLDGMVMGKKVMVLVQNDEIVVSGDCVMSGYYQNPEANRQVFKQCEYERIYHTGDTGRNINGKICWTGRMGDDGKMANGEYITAERLYSLEEKIKKIDNRIEEVMICFENKPYNTALVFSRNHQDQDLKEKIRRELPKIGDGMTRIRKLALLDVAAMELTPTLKLKRKATLEKLASAIDS